MATFCFQVLISGFHPPLLLVPDVPAFHVTGAGMSPAATACSPGPIEVD